MFGKLWNAIMGACEAFILKLYPMPSTDNIAPKVPVEPQNAPTSVLPPETSNTWDTQQHNYHNTRVLCDSANLTLQQKNIVCACIYQESQFYNYLPNGSPVKHENIVNGKVSSTDWGIVQVNDYFHIGVGKDFPSVEYVLSNPDKCIQWMIDIMAKTGKLQPWSSYTSGAYVQWLSTDSPLWLLKS